MKRPHRRRGAPLRAVPLALLLAFLLGGCGGGGHRPTVSVPAASAAVAVLGTPYRWMVPATGPAPTVAQENRAAGTLSWRLPGPAPLIGGKAEGDVFGYVAEQAIAPGQTQTVYVDAPGARKLTVRVYRMGWYHGLGGRLVLQSGPLAAVRQPPCSHDSRTGLTECRWHPTLRFPIPSALASGVYIAVLRTSGGAERDCIFVIRPASPPPLLVQLPTASWEAYNAWGGDSLYPGGADRVGVTGTDQGIEVSFDRPYDSETGAGQFFAREVAIVRFLERYGYPAGYTTDESVDADPRQLHGVRAVIDAGHSEYWSQRQADAFRAARDRGTSLLFLSSDTMAWRVRYRPAGSGSSEAGAPAHRIVAYKEFAALDPHRSAPTGLFPLGGADITGSAYNGCITQRLAVPGPPQYRYHEWRPAPGLQPAWLFAGSGVGADTSIPGIAGYELDQRTPATPAGTRLVGSSVGVKCMSEDEPSPVHGSVGETTLYTAPSGALVFATGMLGWLYGLYPVPEASPYVPIAPDPRIVAITRNVIARALVSR